MAALAALAADVDPSLDEDSESPAWRMLRARALANRGDWLQALLILRGLGEEGELSESLASLLLKAYLALDDTEESTWPEAPADVVLQDQICLMHRQERTGRALSRLGRMRELHPEDLRWTWLDPSFWLKPIRRWIG